MRHAIKAAIAVLVAGGLGLGFGSSGLAQTDSGYRVTQLHKKKRVLPRRAPTRVTVRPTRIIVRPTLRYRYDSTEFPRTDNLGYPGPNAVRQCVSWLATEYRPSGTVVMPHMRCWWQRG